ncbi:MAG: DUF732 domain-containing protein [Planctomycetaceae bacterium]|nr:DUF732 domain-containing protein [Planctomycetaceae bacterium]
MNKTKATAALAAVAATSLVLAPAASADEASYAAEVQRAGLSLSVKDGQDICFARQMFSSKKSLQAYVLADDTGKLTVPRESVSTAINISIQNLCPELDS